MTVLVTGADGFVGRVLIERLLAAGHAVRAAHRAGVEPSGAPFAPRASAGLRLVPLELEDSASVDAMLAAPDDEPLEAIVHLAALASGREARRDPALAWTVNAAGTARLLDAVERWREASGRDPLVLCVSTGEVYGAGPARPRRESDDARPQSPYAASKVGAEVAAWEAARRAGVRVMVARPFAHTGRGQTDLYVVPALARRLREARRGGARTVRTGNLAPVRDFLDVRDVADAYQALLARGRPGEMYNIASGVGVPLAELFQRLAAAVGIEAVAEPDPLLLRSADIPHLVGDADKLRVETGWRPQISFEQTLQELVDAQTD